MQLSRYIMISPVKLPLSFPDLVPTLPQRRHRFPARFPDRGDHVGQLAAGGGPETADGAAGGQRPMYLGMNVH